jgi:hypothetical protein
MSFLRSVYYNALLGGWAAFLGWLISEILFSDALARNALGTGGTVVMGCLVGAMIGAGISLVAGMANAQWRQLLRRAVPGLAGGGLGGAVGALAGSLLYAIGLPRAFGWLILGLGIGVVDGLYERSKSKIRNGLIGGGIGGLVGGFLFEPIGNMTGSTASMSSLAIGFVILGISIGALVGLVQVALKDAWLTVLDGYRTGRQVILGQAVTVLGRAEHLPLPFLGPMNKDLDLEHLSIMRQPNGSFSIEDNHSKLGTRLNNQPLVGRMPLKDGDVIKLGTNFVRFNERKRQKGEAAMAAPAPGVGAIRSAPPPPQVRKPASPGSPPVAKPAAPLPPTKKPTAPPASPRPASPPPAAKRPPGPVPPPPPRPKSRGEGGPGEKKP